MIKKIVRYSLVVFTVIVLFAWMWSAFYQPAVSYRSYQLWSAKGVLVVTKDAWDNPETQPLQFFQNNIRIAPLALESWGLNKLPSYKISAIVDGPEIKSIEIPFWVIFLPIAVVSALVWYRPIRDRWKQKHSVGFAVEPKSTESMKSE